MATQLNDWLSIDKISGTGNAEITLTASSYQELVDRTASIKIQAQSTNAILNVRQTALVPSATLDSYEITTYGGGTYTNGITSNVPWTAVVNGDWITIDKIQGESGYTSLSITVDASTETRNGSIVFNAEGVVLTLEIYQIYDLNKSFFWVEFDDFGGAISYDERIKMSYSFDGVVWADFIANNGSPTIEMGDNKKIYLYNKSRTLGGSKYNAEIKFLNKTCRIGGNASALTEMEEKALTYAFTNNNLLLGASDLILPWSILSESCYSHMFENCQNRTAVPELPATTLAGFCYNSMFEGCTSLVNAPALPATTLAYSCYGGMFQKCTSLVNAPELPATTLADSCYYGMFNRCHSLVNAPELPATTLVGYCYYYMFRSCTSLVNAPTLPATTLVNYCYNNMFALCTSLLTAPELPATTLADFCYAYMFDGCAKLNYIKMLATDISANNCLANWVTDVSSKGTFVKHPDANIPRGGDGIPRGWTVETATS